MAQILIIDDDDQLRRMMRQMLERAGHTVMEAENGRTGLEAFAAEPSDLVVTNLFMPERDGLEVIKAVREDWPEVPVVLVSGGEAQGRALEGHGPTMLRIAERLGAARVIKKPFDWSTLTGAVSELLGAGAPRGA